MRVITMCRRAEFACRSRTGEGQMVQANSTLIERKGVRWIRELVKPDESLTSETPDTTSKRAGALVPVKGHIEEPFVPPDTATKGR